MTNSVTHSHWRVSVETSGEQIVAIETEMLAGREISEADEDAIRTAAHHLLAFIGDPSPQPKRPSDAILELLPPSEMYDLHSAVCLLETIAETLPADDVSGVMMSVMAKGIRDRHRFEADAPAPEAKAGGEHE
jgi:hypothetical protein